jgi:tetratricopeptide (TPR) repeat protein
MIVPRSLLFLVIVTIALSAPAVRAAEYELLESSAPVTANERVSFRITSIDPIDELDLEDLPAHPNLVWLQARNGSITSSQRQTPLHYLSFSYVVLSPGSLRIPPIPVTIGGTSILVRLNAIDALPYPHPEEDTQLMVLWNGSRTPPDSARVGQTLDLEILQLVAAPGPDQHDRSLYFANPGMEIPSVRWHQFGAYPIGYSRDNRFFPFGSGNYTTATTTFQGREFTVRRHKARFIPQRPGQVEGFLHSTMGYSDRRRSPVLNVSFPVLPLPDPPSASFTDTGLIGDWSFSASLDPVQPSNDQPFTLILDIEGTGQPKRIKDLDFSRPGFRSIDAVMETKNDSTFDRWRARFTQTFLPSGTTAVFPAITLGSFDTKSDAWQLHQVTERVILPGFTLPSDQFAPAVTLGAAVQRPVLLNLRSSVFLIFGLLPFLPFAVGLLQRSLKRRDPDRAARRKRLKAVIKQLRSADSSSAVTLINREALPLLRQHLELAGGASTRDIAEHLDSKEPALAELLRQHAAAEFSAAEAINPRKFSAQLARLALAVCAAFFLLPAPLHASTLDEANTFYTEGRYDAAIDLYRELLVENADRPALHLNLAKAQLAADRLAAARATCHTALLLQPRSSEARDLMNRILNELGHPALPGGALLALRPDQLIILGAIIWILAFLYLAVRKLIDVPRWPAAVMIAITPLLLAAAFWRNSTAYAADQYMVVANELHRELTVGTPAIEFPPLDHGEIVRASGSNESKTHILVETSSASFWLPVNQLQQIW